MSATREDWQTTPFPESRAFLSLDRTYSNEELARLQKGRIPEEMEDKWFIFYEEPWLYLHRSWTGYCVFQARFEATPSGNRVTEALVSRDPDQYRSTDDVSDVLLLTYLLDHYAGRDSREAWDKYSASVG
jgi:hypothetical protein